MPSPAYSYVCTGSDVAVWHLAWPGGTIPSITFTVPAGESGTRDFTAYLSDGPSADCAQFSAADVLWRSDDIATLAPGAQTVGWTVDDGTDPLPAGTYDLQVVMTPDGDMTDTVLIGEAVYDALVGYRMSVPLEWSATLSTAVALTSVTDDTAVDDAWQVGLEWSCLLDLDPLDDVEDP